MGRGRRGAVAGTVSQTMKNDEYRKMMGLPPPGESGSVKRPATKPAIRLPRTAAPNKTEAEYGRILATEFAWISGVTVLYEGITLRLPGGNYTPDWTVWNRNTLLLAVECKGAHRHGSAGRSHMAFKAAIAAFPHLVFRFAQKKAEGWCWLDSNERVKR